MLLKKLVTNAIYYIAILNNDFKTILHGTFCFQNFDSQLLQFHIN